VSVGYTAQRSTGSVTGVEAERLQMKAPETMGEDKVAAFPALLCFWM